MLDSLTALGYTSLRDLIASVKEMAPEIWAIYVRQVYVESIAIYGITFILIIGILFSKKNLDFDNMNPSTVVFIACSIFLFMVVLLGILCNGYVSLFNPEYQAIQKLLGR